MDHTLGMNPIEREAFGQTVTQIMPDLVGMEGDALEMCLAKVAGMVKDQHATCCRLVSALEDSRDALIKARREHIDSEWIDAINQYEGEGPVPKNQKQENNIADERAPKLNITQARTDQISAKIRDMLFPANDRNWELTLDDSYPEPEQNAAAELALTKLTDKIDGYLATADYSEHGRKMIDDACKLGTGVLYGPFKSVVSKKKMVQQQAPDGTVVISTTLAKSIQPFCKRIDPKFFYPEMVPMKDCERAFHVELMTRAQLKNLAGQPGFSAQAIEMLLKQEPDLGEFKNTLHSFNSRTAFKDAMEDRYAVWIMHGVLNKDEYEALDIEEGPENKAVCVYFCQGLKLKADEYALDNDLRVPYYTFQYQEADDTPFGHGVPYKMRHGQKTADGTWSAALYNGSVSAGVQTIYKPGKVTPADGVRQIRGPKTWLTKDENVNMDDVFKQWVIPNNIPDLITLLDKNIALTDECLSIPQMIQDGMPTVAQQTAKGLENLIHTQNIVQRRAAKNFDDNVITPFIEKVYWFVIEYDPDQSCKVSCSVSARGTSVLLQKEVDADNLLAISQIVSDARFAPYIDAYELLRAVIQAANVPAKTILKDRKQAEQEQQNQQPPEDPKVTAEKIRQQTVQMQIQGELQKTQLQGQIDLELAQAANVREQMHLAATTQIATDDRNAELAIKDSTARMSLLAKKLDVDHKDRAAGMDARFRAEELATQNRKIDASLSPQNPN